MGALARTVRVLELSGTGRNAIEGIGVRSSASTPPLKTDSKGVLSTLTPVHRCYLPVLHYHKIMVIYLYPFLVVVTQLFSWIIFITDCICILTGSPV